MLKPIHLKEGVRMFLRSLKVRKNGFHKYTGSAKEIAQKIVDDCWNGKYYQTSTGHFSQFWTRDFGFCAESLVKLGYRSRVIKTLDYALDKFQRYGRITTTISQSGKPYDFPTYSADSLPLLVHALVVSDAKELFKKYNKFLIDQLQYYIEKVFDPITSLVKENVHFSSIKDYAVRSSSTYDNSMLAMLKHDMMGFGSYNPLKSFEIELAIKKNLWNGKYFYDDLSRKKHVTGDANIFPFWCNVFKTLDTKDMLRLCIESIEENLLDDPFPLKYFSLTDGEHKMLSIHFLVKDYETNSIWLHMGLIYLQILKKHDIEKYHKHIKRITSLIEEHGTLLEVFRSDGSIFMTPFYISDEGMLWAAIYLNLLEKEK